MLAWVHPCAFLAPSAAAFLFLQYFFGGSLASGESLLVAFQAAWRLQRSHWLVATVVAAVLEGHAERVSIACNVERKRERERGGEGRR